jgi:hypothetical protein
LLELGGEPTTGGIDTVHLLAWSPTRRRAFRHLVAPLDHLEHPLRSMVD